MRETRTVLRTDADSKRERGETRKRGREREIPCLSQYDIDVVYRMYNAVFLFKNTTEGWLEVWQLTASGGSLMFLTIVIVKTLSSIPQVSARYFDWREAGRGIHRQRTEYLERFHFHGNQSLIPRVVHWERENKVREGY